MNSSKLPLIIIMGPTGVGKSDFALSLAEQIGACPTKLAEPGGPDKRSRGEIINCDVGQFYTPLSIGTAKPDWQQSPIAHHLFDIISEPKNFTVTEYRARVERLIAEIRARGNLPIIVGGSGFYVNALFYPPLEEPLHPSIHSSPEAQNTQDERLTSPLVVSDFSSEKSYRTMRADVSWQALNAIDPVRAQQIHPHDHYRIERALQVWYQTGILPSQQKPVFSPVSDNFIVVHVERERSELYQRINERTEVMLAGGWIEEVQRIPAWYPFLLKKRLIGYPEIIEYLQQKQGDRAALCAAIQQATRHYAKRQMTFWRMLAARLQHMQKGDCIMHANLTLSPIELYIRQLFSLR